MPPETNVAPAFIVNAPAMFNLPDDNVTAAEVLLIVTLGKGAALALVLPVILWAVVPFKLIKPVKLAPAVVAK